MNDDIDQLFANNRQWAREMVQQDPEFFKVLEKQQAPEYLWIGCSDSRVPATQITGMQPGEVFVHRNVANNVLHTDMNCQTVLGYAVNILKVKHIIVCGHYGCGGVKVAVDDSADGITDHWVRNIRLLCEKHQEEMEALEPEERVDLACRLNVAEQVNNVATSNILRNAWKEGRSITIHGWIYDIRNGLLRKAADSVTGPQA